MIHFAWQPDFQESQSNVLIPRNLLYSGDVGQSMAGGMRGLVTPWPQDDPDERRSDDS